MSGISVLTAMMLLFATFTVPGCGRALDRSPVGYARKVDDWNGITNLSRDGDVFFAGQPSEEGLRQSSQQGVETVVNLRTPQEMETQVPFDEEATVRRLGMNYVTIPVAPPTLSVSEVDRLRELLAKTDRPVLVHCGSANRVGALWALYLYRHLGFDLEAAIERGRRAGMTHDALIDTVRRIAGESDAASPAEPD